MTAFHKAAGLFQNHIGNFYMMLCGLVEGAGYNLGLYAALHVGNFFGTLIYQKHDFVNLGMIVCNSIGYTLEQHGFTRFGLRNYQTALTLAYGREKVYHTAGKVVFISVSCDIEFFFREERGKEIERYAVADEFRLASIYELYFYQGKVFVPLSRRPDFSGNGVAVFKGVLLDLLLRNVNIVRRIEIIIVG